MTKKQAIQKIVQNFSTLIEKQENDRYTLPKIKAVWFHRSNRSEWYNVDEEWLGVTKEGKIAWAYASGCSCWDGDFDEKECDTETIKEVIFKHEDMKKEWEEKLIEFARTV